ncbi:AAA family ATPase [Vibrio cyclitrophicus]
MKLIKLEIYNFRQFYGKQSIDFSTDPEKPVTLIHGENNGGKTALLNAIRWCLYEETTENLQEPGDLLNKHALEEGQNSFSVNVQLVHDNRIFEVKRSGAHANRANTLRVFEINDGCYAQSPGKHLNTLINAFLPKEMAQYFFYQGEGTGTLSSQNDFSHIKSAISKVLGLTVAEKTITHLKRIKNDYQKDLVQYDTSNEIEEFLSTKGLLESKLQHKEASLIKQKRALLESEKDYELCIKKLDRFDQTNLEDKIKFRSQQEALLFKLQRELQRLVEMKIKSVKEWVSRAYSNKLKSFKLDQVDSKELHSSHKYNVDKKLIKAILENHKCICGADVDPKSATAKIIKDLEESSIDSGLKNRWELAMQLHSRLSSFSSPDKEMVEILSQIDDCEERISELEKSIEELSHVIVDSDLDDIKVLEKERNTVKARRDQLNRDVPILELDIRKIKSDLQNIETRVAKLSSTQPKADKIRKLIHSVNEITDLYEEAIRSSKEGVELILLEKMQTLFSRVAFNGYTVKKSSGTAKDDSFTWVIVDRQGKRVAAGNGYQAMLAISFIISLIQFSKVRANSKQHLLTPGIVAPFIADSILAFIGPDNGRELVRYISESVEQSVFMFSQAQWTEAHTDRGIRDKIGKEYNLVQHTVLTKEEFKGDYPTKLSVHNHDFDVVRFGSEFDKVTIEEISLDD